jgi:hypothetical protein
MDSNMMAVVIAIVALVAIAAIVHWRRHRTHALEKHFGDEFERTVSRLGSRSKAEAELRARKERVDKMEIVPLTREEAARFGNAWQALQARFVDDPRGSLAEADRLVVEVMQKRGYPMGDFEHRAGDISVNHPQIVQHYRASHDIAMRDRSGGVDTEAMRQALIHLRALFSDLLQAGEPSVRGGQRDEHDERGLRPQH